MASTRTETEKQAQKDLLQFALFRWESALTVALTILLTFLFPKPFGWWPMWGWPLLGLIGLATIIYSSLTDIEANQNVLLDAFQQQFDLRAIQDPELRDDVQNALDYQRRIREQIRGMDQTLVRDRMEDTAGRISDWVSNVYKLASRVDTYRQDDLIKREARSLPKEIEQLEAQRRLESDPTILAQLDQVIDSKGQHWQSIRDLDSKIKQAQLQMEQSVTSLATIYSQIQLVDAQDVNSGRAERLQDDIQEQVNRLNDLVESINEVYRADGF